MAVLLQRRLSLLRGLGLGFAIACLLPAAPREATGGFLDAVVAELDGTAVTASDIGLARGLALFGFRPSEAPIRPEDVRRFLDARLVEREAARLGIEATAEEAVAWEAAAARLGGLAALSAWLGQAGIEAAWARRQVMADLRWRQFIDLRFRAFAFVSEMEVSETLGPGPHPSQARERAREALRSAAARQALAKWLVEARRRARIRPVGEARAVPTPFPMPATAGP